MAARTSIIDESADDGVPADFWNDVLDSFDVMDELGEDCESARMAAEEHARKKKEEELEKVKKFNEAWNIAPAAEETRVVEKVVESDSQSATTSKESSGSSGRTKSPDCVVTPMESDVISVEDTIPVSENSVIVIPAEGLPKDPRLKRLENNNRLQSPSSPTTESRSNVFDREIAPSQRYFHYDRDREEQLRKDRENFERARSRLRSRSPGVYSRRSISDDEDDIGRRPPRRYGRSRSRFRSRSRERSPWRARSRSRGRSRHPSRSRSRSRERQSRSSPTAMVTQMNAMMQMMMDPKTAMNPMMAVMMQMNPMLAAAAATLQKSAEAQKGSNEQTDKKDDITAQLFLDNKINLSDYLAAKIPSDAKTARVDSNVVQRIKEAISILDKQETKVQSSRFLYVAPTYYADLKKLDNRSPLIWNDQNVLYASTSKSKDVGLCEPFRNVNRKMKHMIERLGLDEGNVSQRIAQQNKNQVNNQTVSDVGTIQAITIVPVRGGAATRRLIDRSIQTEDLNCLDCVQRRSKTYISVNTQTAIRARTVEVSVQTERDRNVELNSMNDLNANQVKILNEIMKYMKKRQVSGTITNLMHNLERDAPELRNQHLNAGLHYVTEIMERNERNASRYANPNPMNPAARNRHVDQNARSRAAFRDSHPGVNFDEINQLTSMVPAGFRASPPRKSNSGPYNRRPW